MHTAISQPKGVLIGVKVYFAVFSAQRDNWNPTASREKRIDKRGNILSDKSVNGLSPRADEATHPEENTTHPKMPTPRPLPSLVDLQNLTSANSIHASNFHVIKIPTLHSNTVNSIPIEAGGLTAEK